MSDKKISKIKIGIINLKTNNLYSIYNAIKNIGYNVSIIETNTKYLNYDFLIFTRCWLLCQRHEKYYRK